MKLLHTSDWHLGKLFYEHSLIEDQRSFLSQITEELQHSAEINTAYDALIVSGDIYDRAFPPTEAIALLNNFIIQTHESFPSLQLFFLSGNHDSAPRLAPFSQLLELQNIHFCTDCSEITKPVIIKSDSSEDTAIYQLPFLTPGSITADIKPPELFDTPLRKQQELLEEAVKQIEKAHKKNMGTMPAVLSAHLLTTGSLTASSERSYIGTVEQVDSSLFKKFAYTALGHIHKMQKCGSENVCYCGSPLAYSFGEAEKYFLSVTMTEENTKIQKIPVKPLHPVIRLTGSFEEFYEDQKYHEKYKDSYIEIACTDSFITQNPMNILRTKFPYILSFTHTSTVAEGNSSLEIRRKLLSSQESTKMDDIFELFIKDLYKEDSLDKQLLSDEKKLFLTIASKGIES